MPSPTNTPKDGFYRPKLGSLDPSRDRKHELAERKEHFQKLLAFVRAQNGWIVSIPGEREVVIEALPDSTLPSELADIGYEVSPDGEGMRILSHAIVQKFVRGPGGELEPLTEGSTKRVAEVRTHAGIVTVSRFTFSL